MRRGFRQFTGFYAALVVAALAHAQGFDPYAPPAGYYGPATGSGATLKAQLHNIIDGHTVRSYGDARTLLPETDEDPNNPNRMLLVYNRQSHPTAWDNAATWNREHVWPESRGVGSGGPDQSDLHMLRPSLTTINTARGNLNFGGAFGQPFGAVSDKGATVFYPGDADAGMIARQSFYMAVRYDGGDGSTTDLELQSGNPPAANGMGDLDRMIEWHFEAPPDAFERRRNHKVYFDYQHNRNPFVDRPEYAWSIFVNQGNDSSLGLGGAVPLSSGATSLKMNLGRVLVGGPVPAPAPVTLHKSGLNGTYYEVTMTEQATSSVTGRYNAFSTGTTGSQVINVGVAASTDAPGVYGGRVTIDNLDVTTGGGAGRGANDGNDVVFVDLTVLDHANPSFAGASDLNSLSYDFGVVTVGEAAPTFNFEIHNLATAHLAARLDLDSITGEGDVGALSTSLTPFSGTAGLFADGVRTFAATLDTSAAGSFEAIYSLEFSDEDLPGATALGPMTLTLTGTVEVGTAVQSADFDADGAVDGADFLLWQQAVGTTSTPPLPLAGDADGDLLVDGDDLAIWSAQFGQAGGSPLAVPESVSIILLLSCGLVALLAARRLPSEL